MHARNGQRRWNTSRFEQQESEPLGPLANLLDLMLVFACGLIAALIAMSKNVDEHFSKNQNAATSQYSASEKVVTKGRELPSLPNQGQNAGEGYEPVGQVYRDPKTGKLILIGE
ncbi:MAG: DUF2149 domain-containing protein [Gammaproteobacteria bacterium]|nr:DUF2149 domain-containing protein [Gammaproteobacteria bacterium]